jgi:ATP sulfurylase
LPLQRHTGVISIEMHEASVLRTLTVAFGIFRKHVLENMKLPGSNLLFGLPVVLDTTRQDLTPGKKVTLTFQGKPLAVMEIETR